MSAQVSIFDLTDEQVDLAVTARRSRPEPPRPDDAYWLAVMVRRRRETERAEAKRIAVTRRCSRCGIDTTLPDLCRDCTDVLAEDA